MTEISIATSPVYTKIVDAIKEFGGAVEHTEEGLTIYPGIDNDSTECTEYGKQTIRVRIIPYSVDSVLLTGWNGIFDILPFNDKYALLDNASCDEKPWRTALISLSDISKCFLSIKER